MSMKRERNGDGIGNGNRRSRNQYCQQGGCIASAVVRFVKSYGGLVPERL